MGLMRVVPLFCAILGTVLADFPLTILHTNDVHARFVSFNDRQRPCGDADLKANKCWGGAARRLTAMKKFLKEDKNVLKLDAGDQFQGTLWYTALKWEPIAQYMNVMKYDAMAFGNHEFDDGMTGLEPFMRNMTTPIVNSNIEDKGSPIKDLYNRKIIKEVGGQKIGIVGCTTTDVPKVSNPGPQLEFRDEVTALQPIVDELIKSGVNKIIVLSHAGITVDKSICKGVKGVDAVVGGHSHTFLWPDDKPPSSEVPEDKYPVVIKNGDKNCVVVQDFAYGKYLGRLQLNFDDTGDLKSWGGAPVPLDAATFPEDEEIAKILRPYQSQLEHFQKSVVATTAVELNNAARTCRLQECNLGNLLADGALYFYVKRQLDAKTQGGNVSSSGNASDTRKGWSTAGIALWNGGGVRDFMAPAGSNISLEDLFTIMPFQNTIDKITVRGVTLKQAFEHAVTKWNPSDPDGKFLQVSGVKIVFDMSKPENQRVKRIRVRCADCDTPRYEPLNYEKIYDVVTHTYVSGGGDGYTMFKDQKLSSDKSNVLDTDVILDYMKTYRPIIIGEEARIEFYDKSKDDIDLSTALDAGTQNDIKSGNQTATEAPSGNQGTSPAPGSQAPQPANQATPPGSQSLVVQPSGYEQNQNATQEGKPLGEALAQAIANANANNTQG